MALAQTRLVVAAIRRKRPDLDFEIVPMKTTGDKILDKSLDAIGGKGLFIKELDDALASGRVDLCVHSYKDVPVPDAPSLRIVAATKREDPRDVLVLPAGKNELARDLPIGTSSLRRRCQLAALYPDRRCEPVRGNVQTRLRKLDAGEFSGLVLAAAGLKRLGLWDRVSRVFEVDELLPSACQGILAIQGRAGEDYSYLSAVADADAADAASAERSFIEALGATCASPVAAYAAIDRGALTLTGLFVDDDGVKRTGSKTGSRSDARRIGVELAASLKPERKRDG